MHIESIPEPIQKSDRTYYGFRVTKSIHQGGGKEVKLLYANSVDERDRWVETLHDASADRQITSRFHLGDVIGTGKFSAVRHAVEKSTKREFAVKVITKVRPRKVAHEPCPAVLSDCSIRLTMPCRQR